MLCCCDAVPWVFLLRGLASSLQQCQGLSPEGACQTTAQQSMGNMLLVVLDMFAPVMKQVLKVQLMVAMCSAKVE
jgi:hypothetical protein